MSKLYFKHYFLKPIKLPTTSRVYKNSITQLSKNNRGNQECVFLATFKSDEYFIDLSFYRKNAKDVGCYQLNVSRNEGYNASEQDYITHSYFEKQYEIEADAYTDINYWLTVLDCYVSHFPEGITSFNCIPTYEKRDTTSQVIQVLTSLGYTYKFTKDVYPNAYLILSFEKNKIDFEIWLHNIYPWFCIKKLNNKLLQDLLSHLQFLGIYCNNDFLNQKLEDKQIKMLNKYEKKQIHKWQPQTVGSLVFNQWD